MPPKAAEAKGAPAAKAPAAAAPAAGGGAPGASVVPLQAPEEVFKAVDKGSLGILFRWAAFLPLAACVAWLSAVPLPRRRRGTLPS